VLGRDLDELQPGVTVAFAEVDRAHITAFRHDDENVVVVHERLEERFLFRRHPGTIGSLHEIAMRGFVETEKPLLVRRRGRPQLDLHHRIIDENAGPT
jgi:hypothetical protein